MVSASLPKSSRASKPLLSALLAATLVPASWPVWAQASDTWQFQGAVNLYLPDISGKTGVQDISIGGLPMPAGASAKADYDLKGWGWTLAVGWHAVTSPATTLDVVAGARLLDIEQTLTWDITGNVGSIPAPGRAATSRVGLSHWDAIVGVKGRLALSADRKWLAPYCVDVGAGESQLTWQALGVVGYSFPGATWSAAGATSATR